MPSERRGPLLEVPGRAIPVEVGPRESAGRIRAMASDVTVRVVHRRDPIDADFVRDALRVFTDVQDECSRFDPRSPLAQVNIAPDRWHRVPPYCFDALRAAHAAYRATAGVFDPRILADLRRLGYADSADGAAVPDIGAAESSEAPAPGRSDWNPRFRPWAGEVRVGADPVDLGGIGKGLAVRWATERLTGTGSGFLVDAGGDSYCAGEAPDGGPWRVGVEDPAGGALPLAVLALCDTGCATSSVRIRRWQAGGLQVHHLIDPGTGRPGGAGLLAVTVVDADPADAEVWSKVLFLGGADDIAAQAAARGLAALWVGEDGAVGWSESLVPHLIWTAT